MNQITTNIGIDLARDGPDPNVGTGTVMNESEAQQSVEAGAQFLVSPVMDVEVIRAATQLGVASMPGTQTPTEMLQAQRAGADLCKLFPAPEGGPDWVRAVLGPMPSLKIVPTNGVDHKATSIILSVLAIAPPSSFFGITYFKIWYSLTMPCLVVWLSGQNQGVTFFFGPGLAF